MADPSTAPVPAATVVLVRRGRMGLEVLMTRRPVTMAFAPDVHVFPGGRVDQADGDPDLARRSALTPAAAARALGGDLPEALALAVHVAAIRELFEEAGVLLADGNGPATAAGRGADHPQPAAVGRGLGAARTALVGGETTFAAIVGELDLRLRTDLLVPLSRWVTPPTFPRRFDARFFAAELPAGARVSFEGDEVADHSWRTPAAALRAMADGTFPMWVPTGATLQQLEHIRSVAEMRERLAPGSLGEVVVEEVSPHVVRITMPAGGGVAGQPVCSYLVGRRRCLIVDPGDPTGPGLERAVDVAVSRGSTIAAIALTQVGPDHAGGAEALAETLGVPILAGPGGGDPLPYDVTALADDASVEAGDVAVVAVHTPGPRPEHLAFVIDDGRERTVIAGDLDGRWGARTVVGPVDEAATARSIRRLRALAPGARWLTGHPPGASGVDGETAGPEARRDA